MFKLEVLSPTHIGNGGKISKLDFGIRNNHVYIFSLHKIMEGMSEANLNKLISFVESYGENGSFTNMGELLTQEFRLSRWETMCNYIVPLIDTDRGLRDINEHIKTGDHKVYIPGSSLKGAIRTAITYCLLKDRRYRFEVERRGETPYMVLIKPNGTRIEGLTRDRRGNMRSDTEKLEREINKDLFGGSPEKDIFKTLILSDSASKEANNCLEVRKVYVANTSSFSKNRRGRVIKMHPEYYECIKKDTVFENIRVKLKENLKETNVASSYRGTINYIENWKECVYRFSMDLLETEIKFWSSEQVEKNISRAYSGSPHREIVRSFKKDEVIKHLKKIKEINEPQAPVIRLGKLSGYFAHSAGLLLAQNGYDIGDDLANLLFPFQHRGGPHPLTRRLTLDNQTLGWCRIMPA